MAADEDDTREPEPDPQLAGAVDDAMKREVWRALAPQFQHLAFESRRVQPPRDRNEIDEILDKIRDETPDDERPD
ncbi:hypothetical protein ACR9E3_22815 [Actinomycetospora sp. C-140]